MTARLNALLHMVSALYAVVLVGFVVVFVPRSLVSQTEVRLLLVVAVSFLVLDAAAAFLQWRKPASARTLSVALHFAFCAEVIAIVTLEYLQNQSFSVRWLLKNDYGFFLLLGLCRLLAVGFLLEKEPRGKSAPSGNRKRSARNAIAYV